MLDITKITLNGLNLFTYCLNNPVNEVDENGYFISLLLGLLIAAIVGAAVGTASYTVSYVVKGITTGNWEWNWAEFLGSTIGGLLGGMFSLIPGVGTYVAAFMTGVFTSLISDALNTAIYGKEFNLVNSLAKGTIQGILAVVFVGLTNATFSINGINSGRGSWRAVTDQIFTKLKRGTIKRISLKTFGKILGLSLFDSSLETLYNGLF